MVAPNIRGELGEIWDRAPRPDSFPAFRDLVTSRTGTLWIRLFRSWESWEDGPAEWLVIDPETDAEVRGRRVTLPPDGELLDIDADRAAVLRTDSLDVQSVHIYRFPGLLEAPGDEGPTASAADSGSTSTPTPPAGSRP
jgi:hypothetical protein